jgi:hypothetical protein
MYVVRAQVSINGRQDGWALAAWLVEEFASGRWTSLQTRCARGQPTRWCTVMQDRVLSRNRVHCAATSTRCACAHRVPYGIPWQMSYGKVAFVNRRGAVMSRDPPGLCGGSGAASSPLSGMPRVTQNVHRVVFVQCRTAHHTRRFAYSRNGAPWHLRPTPLLRFFADACGRGFASQHLCKGM